MGVLIFLLISIGSSSAQTPISEFGSQVDFDRCIEALLSLRNVNGDNNNLLGNCLLRIQGHEIRLKTQLNEARASQAKPSQKQKLLKERQELDKRLKNLEASLD